jgi:threonine/homoserine/homoserine lactone efflux protein
MHLASFVVASLALNLAPGPDMTYVAARSIGQGRRAGVVSALGIGAGCIFHIAAAAAGLAVLLRAWPEVYAILRWVGVAYLIYLGLGLLRRARTAGELTRLNEASDWMIFRQGVVTNILNPKVALFFVAFLPQFLDPSQGPVVLQTLALGCYFNAQGTLVNVTVAWVAGAARTLLTSATGRVWFERAAGTILVALGVRLAIARN